ncbi:hypothetical protein WJX74_005606 [Apatococcus lobatus]|uniref:Protein kinase domain-containing protein n=1 Tax=Apatococcus lobatus TaxID=904363 RepID=A0AAW1SDY3_9CHLO
MVAVFQPEAARDSRVAVFPRRKSYSVSRSDSSPLSVLDFITVDSPLPVPGCTTPLTSPEAPVFDGSPSPNLPQSPLLASQKLFARLSSTNFRTPGRGTSSNIPPRAAQIARAPSPQRQKGARARFKGRKFGRSSSLNENKVLLATQLRRTPSLACPDLFHFDEHFIFLSVLGRTRLSEVFHVKHRETQESFAVKRSTKKLMSKAHRERCMHEIMAIAALPAHDNIVGQYRAWQQEGHFYLQMDLCEGGNLAELISNAVKLGEPLSESQIWDIFLDIAQGLDFLHMNGVVHLDIKPENLYRDLEGMTKIGDFGLAVLRHAWDWEEGDGDFVAPELLRPGGHAEPSADIFSFGATLYELSTGERLPRTSSQINLPGRSELLQSTIRQMLLRNPVGRPSAATLCDLSLTQVESHSDDEANPVLAASCLTPRDQRLVSPQSAATLNATASYQGFYMHGRSQLTPIAAGETPCSAEALPSPGVLLSKQAAKRRSTTPFNTPFLQCQLMGTFDSPSSSPSSPHIPICGSALPVGPSNACQPPRSGAQSSRATCHDSPSQMSTSDRDRLQVRATSSLQSGTASEGVPSPAECQDPWRMGLPSCRSSPAALGAPLFVTSERSGLLSGVSSPLQSAAAAAQESRLHSPHLTQLQLPCQEQQQAFQPSLLRAQCLQLQLSPSTTSTHHPRTQLEQGLASTASEYQQPGARPDNSCQGQQDMTQSSKSQAQDAGQLQLPDQLLHQAQNQHRPGVPSLEVPDISPATPVQCESPWTDSAGGLALHGPAPHSSFWRRPASHNGLPGFGAGLDSPPCPAASSAQDNLGAATSAVSSMPYRTPILNPGAPADGHGASFSRESPTFHALPPCFVSETPVVEQRKRRPGRLAEQGGLQDALGSSYEANAKGQHWRPPHAMTRKWQGTTEHTQESAKPHSADALNLIPESFVDQNRPAVEQVISPFSIPQSSPSDYEGPKLSAESPFSIRQPLHWQMSHSSSSRCMSSHDPSLLMHSVSSHASATGALSQSSSGSLHSYQAANTWRAADHPSLSLSLPDASWLHDHPANAAMPWSLQATAAALQDQGNSMQPTGSLPEITSGEAIPSTCPQQLTHLQPEAKSRMPSSTSAAEAECPIVVHKALGEPGLVLARCLGPTLQQRVPGLKRHASQSLSSRMSDMQLDSDHD